MRHCANQREEWSTGEVAKNDAAIIQDTLLSGQIRRGWNIVSYLAHGTDHIRAVGDRLIGADSVTTTTGEAKSRPSYSQAEALDQLMTALEHLTGVVHHEIQRVEAF